MDAWLERSGIDVRFVNLSTLMLLGVWPYITVMTFGLAVVAWKFVVLCQAIALPFSVAGWAIGFRQSARLRWGLPARAMVAGWSGLIAAEAGLALVLAPWFGSGSVAPGLWSLPALVVLLTIGVLWLYRAETWLKFAKGMAA